MEFLAPILQRNVIITLAIIGGIIATIGNFLVQTHYFEPIDNSAHRFRIQFFVSGTFYVPLAFHLPRHHCKHSAVLFGSTISRLWHFTGSNANLHTWPPARLVSSFPKQNKPEPN